jgi:hypothetical protein
MNAPSTSIAISQWNTCATAPYRGDAGERVSKDRAMRGSAPEMVKHAHFYHLPAELCKAVTGLYVAFG